MVVAAQDVMDALAQELGRRGRRRLCCDFTPRCRGGCCNDLRCRRCDRRRNDALGPLRIEHPQHRRLARELDARDAAMGRIDFAQNRVANRRRRRRHTVSLQRQRGIDAIDAPFQCARRRLQLAARDLHARGDVGFDVRPRSANLAPGQLAVGVRIEIECDVEIAQRDVDTHGGAGIVARELQVGIARLVRPRQRRCEREQQRCNEAKATRRGAHHGVPFLCAAVAPRGPHSPGPTHALLARAATGRAARAADAR